ncbi:hypothetical protein AMTR_s00351p00009890 [Amborella trichopoda]|uniref:N-acyl-aliphatic-L-amino acid amidohydrolase n=2 Tax=Amborella trichopoda TaxID=13333 RepID=W1NQ44_AMBTC|nr:hypothetical protein AMTR_s00351p00009890 [Amborella trichopoda]
MAPYLLIFFLFTNIASSLLSEEEPVAIVFRFQQYLNTTSSFLSEKETVAIISRFQQYLQIDTAHPNPNYSLSTAFILSLAQAIGLESETLEFVEGKPVVILKWPGKKTHLSSILLSSHTDIVPSENQKWVHPPLSAHIDHNGDIYARGSQDMKCVGLQYLEAIKRLKINGFEPVRTVYLSFVPDEEIGGKDGTGALVNSKNFEEMNVGVVLDEGVASPDENYRVSYGERSLWWLVIKAVGSPGHGSKLYDKSAMENLQKSLESVWSFRASQFDLVKSGLKKEWEVISVNPVFLKAGMPSPTGFVMNVQPSEAEAGFDIRVPPHADSTSLERRIEEEWAPASRNMTFQFKDKFPTVDKFGNPAFTATDASNSWWTLFEEAVKKAHGNLAEPEIFLGGSDARYFRERNLPVIAFSPISNTPILHHHHNEFLNKEEYLKGIKVYESIIKTFASFDEPIKEGE